MTLSIYRIARLVCSLLLLPGCALVSYPTRADVIQPEDFGMHVHGMARGGDWPNLDFGYLRLWDAGVLWRHLEPNKGEWNFQLLDRYVREAQSRGVKVLLTLGQPPQWAAARPDSKSPYGDGASSEPRSLDDWRNYVGTVARRYKGRIHAYELWNEVDVKHFWSGDYTKLVELEKAAVDVIKAEDPAAVVLSASVQGGAFKDFNAYLDAGGGRYTDGIGYHFYALTEAPEVIAERIRRVREIMASHGLGGKPLWNTEYGWLIANRDGGYGNKPNPQWNNWRKPEQFEAAGFVLRAFLIAFNGGIRHNFWYAWDNGAMGLAEDKGKTPKPAATGFIRAREWLVGANFMGCANQTGVWQCGLERDGRKQWIVWANTEQDFRPPADWHVAAAQRLFDAKPMPLSGPGRIGPLPTLFSP